MGLISDFPAFNTWNYLANGFLMLRDLPGIFRPFLIKIKIFQSIYQTRLCGDVCRLNYVVKFELSAKPECGISQKAFYPRSRLLAELATESLIEAPPSPYLS